MKPSEQHAENLGRRAAERGEPRYNNPYHCATARAAVNWSAWFRGYDSIAKEAAK